MAALCHPQNAVTNWSLWLDIGWNVLSTSTIFGSSSHPHTPCTRPASNATPREAAKDAETGRFCKIVKTTKHFVRPKQKVYITISSRKLRRLLMFAAKREINIASGEEKKKRNRKKKKEIDIERKTAREREKHCVSQ